MTLPDNVFQPYVPPTTPLPQQQRPRRPRRHFGRVVITLIVLVCVVLGSVLIVTNRQRLVDQWTVWNYTSSSVIEGYVDRSTMTEHGEFLFKASQPRVTSSATFNAVCQNKEEGSGVLGCYTGFDRIITLFDITDERLDGMEEVVAAHEMLHAAWDRLGVDEQARLGVLLEAEASKLSEDAQFAARMEVYARTEPGERLNELHSILGTEVADLGPELIEYYSAYFTDRAALVALHQKSSAVFEGLAAQSAALVAELDALKSSMEADLGVYNAGYDQLNADIHNFNRRADNGEFTSQQQFDNERASLLRRQSELDALFASIQSRERTWEQKHAQLEQLNAEAAALNTAINVVPRTTDE